MRSETFYNSVEYEGKNAVDLFSSKNPRKVVRVYCIIHSLKYCGILIDVWLGSARLLKITLHWIYQQVNDPKQHRKSGRTEEGSREM